MHSLPNLILLKGNQDTSRAPNNNKSMFVSDILEKLSLSPRSAHQSPLSVNHQIFTSFEQWRSFLSSCYWISSKLSKWRILVTMTMHHYHCHWSHALYQVFKKKCTCSYKKDHCWLFITLSHTVEFLWFSSVVVDKFTASFEVLSGLIKINGSNGSW